MQIVVAPMTADDSIVTCSCGKPHRYDTDPHEWKPPMKALDADTLRDLRNLWMRDMPTIQGDGSAVTSSELVIALVNAAPALLDAAEALAWLVELKDGPRDQRYFDTKEDAWAAARAALAPPPDNGQQDDEDEGREALRAMQYRTDTWQNAAPPPDPLAYTTHDDYDDEPPEKATP